MLLAEFESMDHLLPPSAGCWSAGAAVIVAAGAMEQRLRRMFPRLDVRITKRQGSLGVHFNSQPDGHWYERFTLPFDQLDLEEISGHILRRVYPRGWAQP